MKNLLMQDMSVRENCETILRGSYPEIAKQLSQQLLLALDELEAAQQSVQADVCPLCRGDRVDGQPKTCPECGGTGKRR